MSTIPAKNIVDVTPAVLSAGGSALDLNGLFLTENTRVPIGTAPSFASAAAVSAYFGASSTEKSLADIYFGGFQDSLVSPAALLFAQYNDDDVSAYLRGGVISAMTLAALQALSGTLTVVVDGYSYSGSVNLAAATSFSSAASIIQTALNAGAVAAATITGSISGTTLTVTATSAQTLGVGKVVSGTGGTPSAATVILAQLSGTLGGTGTYSVSNSQTVLSKSMTVAPGTLAVTYDSVSGAFVVTSGITGALSTIAFATGAMATSLLMTSATGAVLSQGAAAAASPSAFMDALVLVTQNWATFTTIMDPDDSGFANKYLFAAWADAQNNRFGYVCWDTDLSASVAAPATGSLGYAIQQADLSGTFLLGQDTAGTDLVQVAAFVCGVGASIDFTRVNGRTNYCFRRQTGLTACVTNETAAENLIANGYNFYGTYGTANDSFTWLYNGQVSGPFSWMDSFVNQIQLNNAFQLALMELLQNTLSIPYNPAGRAIIEAALADPINAGLSFGTFRAGVTLSAAQKTEINDAAGVNAATVLQNRGWYLQVLDASPTVRQARGSPPCTFWYTDGESVQKIDLTSINVQ